MAGKGCSGSLLPRADLRQLFEHLAFLWGRVQGKAGAGAENPQSEEAGTAVLCIRTCCRWTLLLLGKLDWTLGGLIGSAGSHDCSGRLLLPACPPPVDEAESLRSLPENVLAPSCGACVWKALDSCA